jgi:hypothetical protein
MREPRPTNTLRDAANKSVDVPHLQPLPDKDLAALARAITRDKD